MNIITTDDPGLIGVAQFDGRDVRIAGTSEHPLFVLADVCDALELEGPRFVARKLDDDEKGVLSMHTPGGTQQMTVVSESGLYAIILRCRSAMTPGTAAYRFRRWVTNEVLPAIRKTGRYTQPMLDLIESPKSESPKREAMDLLPGDKLGDLVIVGDSEIRRQHRMVVARCNCGSEFTTRATAIRTGRITKCPVCSRKQAKRTPPAIAANDFLLATYQLALANSSKSESSVAVMDWCHQQMTQRTTT